MAVMAPPEWLWKSTKLHPRDIRVARILFWISGISMVNMRCRIEILTRSTSGISTESLALVVFFGRIL
jgi:hypothetical protein